ncbi:MAG: prephenate dehydrogenase [Kiritimatiellia bacterium]
MNVAVIGRGLIGGSFEKASRKAGHAVTILHHGDATGFETADLILVCLPPQAIVPWVRDHAAAFRPGTLVVDICGVKQSIMRAMAEVPRAGWTFVGGHPMAGREVAGYENSLPDLFVGASMILTPFEGTAPAVIETLTAYFASIGFAETVITTPARHDEMIGFTSQLCHVIATTYARDPRVKDAIGFSAGSYANMTRIATQNASDWSALYSENRAALVGVLDGFLARFRELRDAIAADDGESVRRQIEEGARAKRQELLDRRRGDENV